MCVKYWVSFMFCFSMVYKAFVWQIRIANSSVLPTLQTGCNPASALASFSKRSFSPTRQGYGGLVKDDLELDRTSFGSRSSYPGQDEAVQTEGSTVIPCEFCGIQLEEEVLFHHQVQNCSRLQCDESCRIQLPVNILTVIVPRVFF